MSLVLNSVFLREDTKVFSLQSSSNFRHCFGMAVLLNTDIGDIVIDLFVNECPVATKNFIKLCQLKYYNCNLIYNVQQNYIMQAGDPSGTGKGGNSVFGVIVRKPLFSFPDEINERREVNKVGYVGMAHSGDLPDTNRSQFFITLRGEDMEHLGKTHTIIGEVAEGLEVLEKINNLFCDEEGRPYQDVRILHTFVLDDPFPDLDGMIIPPESPVYQRPPEERISTRIPYEDLTNITTNTAAQAIQSAEEEAELEENIRKREAKSRAIVLEMLGDIPDADVKPPEEVLFVCKLNPVTRDDDLELIFSQFGTIKSCEIIRDYKTGDSLNYAFIEFDSEEACLRAYEKMNNALIDDRRIKVDFSQSVSKLWNRFLMQPRKSKKQENQQQSQLILRPKQFKQSPQDNHYGPSSSNKDHHQQQHPIKEEKIKKEFEKKKKYRDYEETRRDNRNHRDHSRVRKEDDRDNGKRKDYRIKDEEEDNQHHHKKHRRDDSRDRNNDREHRRHRSRSNDHRSHHHEEKDQERRDRYQSSRKEKL
jgi:peptidyl-prolyl cis-trans isomerase-like 4